MSELSILALGFLLGLRHATDADHVVAVSTIVSRERRPLAALAVGAWWGLGHTLTLVSVGGAIVLFGLVVPPRFALALEFSVALMLIVLGALNMQRAFAGVGRAWRLRPLMVGLVHGLAGSAALALLVLASVHHAGAALLYLGIFSAGTVLGMILLTGALFLPLAAAARRFASLERSLARATGAFSVAFGLFLAYHIGFAEGLLLPK